MQPRLGTPLKDWTLASNDFNCLVSDQNGENLTVMAATWVGLLQDSPVDGGKTYRQGVRFYNRIAQDLQGLVREYAELGDELLRSISLSDGGSVKVPLFRKFSKTPIFREYLYWYRYGDPESFSYIMSFLWHAKKAEYKDATFNERSLESWLRVEQQNSKVQLSQHILDDLRDILRKQNYVVAADMESETYDRYDIDAEFTVPTNGFVFRHGPGAVAESGLHTTEEKNNSMEYHHQLATLVDHLPATPYLDLVIPDQLKWDSQQRNLRAERSSTISKLQFVPKDYKQSRTICMEPVSFMWAQQALLNGMVVAIRESHLADMIDLTSQEKNRQQALHSSEDHEFGCIDMSYASDTVLTDLVRGVFQGRLRELLFATRTDRVELPTGDVVRVKKFAPMGSAVCFPTQCIIFSLAVILVNHLTSLGVSVEDYITSGVQHVGKHDWPRSVRGSCVFGDDIICPDSQTRAVMTILTTLGFKVNDLKSFYGDSCVRESCGMFALDGADVSPILFKTKGIMEDSPESRLGRIALCNAYFARGYVHARNAVLRSLAPRYYVITNPDSPYATQGYAVHGYEEMTGRKERENKELFRTEFRIFRPVDILDATPGSEIRHNDSRIRMYRLMRDSRSEAESRYRLALWLARPFSVEGGGSVALPSSGDRPLKWDWRWTPVS